MPTHEAYRVATCEMRLRYAGIPDRIGIAWETVRLGICRWMPVS